MNDTRETLAERLTAPRVAADNEHREDIASELRPEPRFQAGDRVIPASHPNMVLVAPEPYWDYEFSGWLISPGLIGVHECNFIPEAERALWEPHADGLWSWWTRVEAMS
jgi:hypothetical protein